MASAKKKEESMSNTDINTAGTTSNEAGTNTTGATTAAASSDATTKTKARAIVSDVRKGLPMPEKAAPRGRSAAYDFASLEVGDSFGVKGLTLKGFSSTLTQANKKYAVQKKDANGQPMFKTTEVKTADGTVTHVPNLKKPILEFIREFQAFPVKADEDPDGAEIRVWRVK